MKTRRSVRNSKAKEIPKKKTVSFKKSTKKAKNNIPTSKKSVLAKKRDTNGISQDESVKKKPSKADLKSVIDALQKESSLLLVRKALKYIPFYLKSEGLTKKLLKEIIRLWAEAGEKIRVVCLLCLIRIYTKLQDKERKQLVIKKLYTSFMDKCRVTKQDTMSMIGFMRHSLIELFKLDPEIAFKQAQASCQQLSVTLKNAYTHKNEETYKTVLNWQFANCLKLLSNLITSHDTGSPVKALTNQIINLNLGALNFLTSPRYYPYYCHLIENLIGLSICTKLFIPVIPPMLSIMNKIQMPHNVKVNSKEDNDEESKEYNMDLLNHVSLDETQCPEYNIAVLDRIHHLMEYYLASQCHRIAFPELVLLPNHMIRRWLKTNTGQPGQKFKTLVDKMKTDCETIQQARNSVTFSFEDYAAVDAWEKRMRDSNKLIMMKSA